MPDGDLQVFGHRHGPMALVRNMVTHPKRSIGSDVPWAGGARPNTPTIPQGGTLALCIITAIAFPYDFDGTWASPPAAELDATSAGSSDSPSALSLPPASRMSSQQTAWVGGALPRKPPNTTPARAGHWLGSGFLPGGREGAGDVLGRRRPSKDPSDGHYLHRDCNGRRHHNTSGTARDSVFL